MYLLKNKDNLELGTTGPFGLTRFRIRQSERETHTYVVGITGKGKSKLLEHILFQDIVNGRGCGVLDPHSDLIEDLLRYLLSNPLKAQGHWERIIYFDPSRQDYLIPFNVLDSGFSPYETAQNVVEAFRRTWPKALAEAPRFANIVTASVLTLVANKQTLVELPRLLTDAGYRARLLENIEDPELRSFWQDRYEKWGRETPVMIESVLNKVTAFTLNPQLRLILGARENRLNFRKIMDEGNVLLADLGRCDVETRRLLGSLLVTGLEQAARSRKDDKRKRSPYYFCIDEFQDFCANDGGAQTLAQILSESRKFGLHLTLAHQTLSQLNERMTGALGNIQLKVVFGVSRSDAEILASHLFQVDGEQIKHMVEDVDQQGRSHPVFYSLQEEWEKIVQLMHNLPPRVAFASSPRHRKVRRLRTITLRYESRDTETVENFCRQRLHRNGVSRSNLEDLLKNRYSKSKVARKQAPIVRTRRSANRIQ